MFVYHLLNQKSEKSFFNEAVLSILRPNEAVMSRSGNLSLKHFFKKINTVRPVELFIFRKMIHDFGPFIDNSGNNYE